MTLQVSTPATITSKGFFCSNNNIGTNDECRLTFITVNPLSKLSKIRIIFPPQLSLALLTVVGQTGVKPGSLAYTNLGSNTILLTDAVDNYKAAGTNFTIVFRYVTLPTTTAATSSFVVTTESPAGGLVSRVSSGFTYQAAPGLINSITITAAIPTVATTTTFTFLFTPSSSLPATGGVKITFPSELVILDQGSGACLSGNTPAVNPTLSCSANSQVLTVSAMFSSYTGGNPIGFTVNSVTNPSSTKPTSTFTIQTFSDITNSATLTDQSTTATYAATNYAALSLSSITIVPSSFTVSTLSTYTFTFKNAHTLFALGTIIIQLPSTITIPDTTTTQDSFAPGAVFGGSASLAVTSSALTITNAVATDLAAGSTISFSVSGLQNPPTLQPTASFTILTRTFDAYSIDGINSGVTVTMTTVPTFSQVQITPTSYYNGASTTYRFAVTVRNPHYSGDYLEIVFPSAITFSNIPTCSAVSNLGSISGVKSGQNLRVTLAFSSSPLAALLVFVFDVSTFTNPTSVEPFPSIGITSYSSAGYKREETLTGITFTTLPNILSSITVEPENPIPGAATSYTVQFTSVVAIPSAGSIAVRIPTEITVSSPTCTFNQGVLGPSASCSYTEATRTILVTNGGPFSTTISFTIDGLTNPSSGTSSTFQVYTYDGGNYEIDQKTTSLTYEYLCTLPCNTCMTGQPSNCTSCFTSEYTDKIYLYYGSCLTACPTDAPPDSSNVCASCGSGCISCSASTCTECSSNYTLVNGTCTLIATSDTSFASALKNGAPFPFLITAACFIVFLLVAQSVYKKMSFTTNLLAFFGFLEFMGIFTFLILMSKERGLSASVSVSMNNADIILIVFALVVNYLLNVVLIVYYAVKINKDAVFLEWRNRENMTCGSRTILCFSALTSLKFFPIFHGKFLQFKVFTAKCSSVTVLYPLAVLMCLHSLLTGITAIASSAIYLQNVGLLPVQATIMAIELPILVVLTFIIFLFETRKSKNYFDMVTAEDEKYLKVDEESRGVVGLVKGAQVTHKKEDGGALKGILKDVNNTRSSIHNKDEKGVGKDDGSVLHDISSIHDETLIVNIQQKGTGKNVGKKPFDIQRQELISIQNKNSPSGGEESSKSNRYNGEDDIPTLRKGATVSINRQKSIKAQDRSMNDSLNESSANLLYQGKQEKLKELKEEDTYTENVEAAQNKRIRESGVLGGGSVRQSYNSQRGQNKATLTEDQDQNNISKNEVVDSNITSLSHKEKKSQGTQVENEETNSNINEKGSATGKYTSNRNSSVLTQSNQADQANLTQEEGRVINKSIRQSTQDINMKGNQSNCYQEQGIGTNESIRQSVQGGNDQLARSNIGLDQETQHEEYGQNTLQQSYVSKNVSGIKSSRYETNSGPGSPEKQTNDRRPRDLIQSNDDWDPELYSKEVGGIPILQNNSYVDPFYVPDKNKPLPKDKLKGPADSQDHITKEEDDYAAINQQQANLNDEIRFISSSNQKDKSRSQSQDETNKTASNLTGKDSGKTDKLQSQDKSRKNSSDTKKADMKTESKSKQNPLLNRKFKEDTTTKGKNIPSNQTSTEYSKLKRQNVNDDKKNLINSKEGKSGKSGKAEATGINSNQNVTSNKADSNKLKDQYLEPQDNPDDNAVIKLGGNNDGPITRHLRLQDNKNYPPQNLNENFTYKYRDDPAYSSKDTTLNRLKMLDPRFDTGDRASVEPTDNFGHIIQQDQTGGVNNLTRSGTIKNNFFELNQPSDKNQTSKNRYPDGDESNNEIQKKGDLKSQDSPLRDPNSSFNKVEEAKKENENWAEPAPMKRKHQYEIEDHGDIVVGASHEFVNEDTPSNYDAMNQRYDDDVNHRIQPGSRGTNYQNLAHGSREMQLKSIHLPQLKTLGMLFFHLANSNLIFLIETITFDKQTLSTKNDRKTPLPKVTK